MRKESFGTGYAGMGGNSGTKGFIFSCAYFHSITHSFAIVWYAFPFQFRILYVPYVTVRIFLWFFMYYNQFLLTIPVYVYVAHTLHIYTESILRMNKHIQSYR